MTEYIPALIPITIFFAATFIVAVATEFIKTRKLLQQLEEREHEEAEKYGDGFTDGEGQGRVEVGHRCNGLPCQPRATRVAKANMDAGNGGKK